MEQLVDIGEQLIFILMGLASVLALAVGFERAIIFQGLQRAEKTPSKQLSSDSEEKISKVSKSLLRIQRTFTHDLPDFLLSITLMDKKR